MESTLFLISLLKIGTVFGGEAGKGCCNHPVDVVFVLDESGSIWGPHFTQQLNFVQSTIDTFDVGFNRTHVGVLTFGTNNRNIFPLGKYTEKQELKNAVKAIKQQRGETYTHLALKRLREEMFSRQYARPWVRYVAIIITDGESNYPAETEKEAQLCHDDKIQMFAIGVGTAVARKELEAIASSPDLVFTVNDYAALESLRQILPLKLCEPMRALHPPSILMNKGTVVGGKPNKECSNTPIDLVFVLDDSSSSHFFQQLDFVQNTIETFDVGFNRTHVGVLTFGTNNPIIFPVGKYTEEQELKNAVKAIQQRRGETYTHLALKGLREMFSPLQSRSWVDHVAIIITEGESINTTETEREAQLCHSEKIRMFAIGVGENVSQCELKAIATSPGLVVSVRNYSDLEPLRQSLAGKACEPETVFGSKLNKMCCNHPVDVVFVLDESRSIWGPHFMLQLEFVQNTIETFKDGFNKIRFGVLTFGTSIRIIFPLGKYTYEQELKNAVKAIEQHGGETYTHLALKRLRKKMFSRQYAQSCADHVAIIITDGESINTTETEKEAQLCHNEKIRMFAIGVGAQLEQKELEAIASSPDLVFTVSNYAALESLRQNLVLKACEPPPSPITTMIEPPSQIIEGTVVGGKPNKACGNNPVDLVFVFDESGCISDSHFRLVLNFIQNTIETFDVRFNKTHVGVMTFGTNNRIIFPLGKYTEEQELKDAVKAIKQQRCGLCTHHTLKRLREEMFSRQYARPWVRYMAIIVTGGESVYPAKTESEAQLCHAEKIQMFAIGVGTAVARKELEAIASSPDLVFAVKDYDALQSIRQIVISKACKHKRLTKSVDIIIALDTWTVNRYNNSRRHRVHLVNLRRGNV